MLSWLHQFRKLDIRQKQHRQTLIDTFINAIYLYDDKIVITFNCKDGTETVSFDTLQTVMDDPSYGVYGSDLDCPPAPWRGPLKRGGFAFA